MYSKVIEKFVIKIHWIYSAISLNIRIVSIEGRGDLPFKEMG